MPKNISLIGRGAALRREETVTEFTDAYSLLTSNIQFIIKIINLME